MTTFPHVVAFVRDHAGEAELDALTNAFNTRRRKLREERAASLELGQRVRLEGVKAPYKGLTGDISDLGDAQSQTLVLLDEASTTQLRLAGIRVPTGRDREMVRVTTTNLVPL